MPLTDMERDDLRMAAKNHVRETREEWLAFRAQGREYLEEPNIDLARLQELLDAPRTTEHTQRTETQTDPSVGATAQGSGHQQVPGLPAP